jgi:hypothetical protein
MSSRLLMLEARLLCTVWNCGARTGRQQGVARTRHAPLPINSFKGPTHAAAAPALTVLRLKPTLQEYMTSALLMSSGT